MKTTHVLRLGCLLASCLGGTLLEPTAFGQSSSGSASTQAAPATPSRAPARKKAHPWGTEIENPTVEIDAVLQEISRLEERFGRLQRDYGNPEQPFPVEELKKQYEEATYLFLVEDYEKASLMFYTVLEKANRVSFPEYEEAEYYLAESLALGKNYFPALEYFTRMVDYGPAHRYYNQAVVRMVELYGKTNNFDKFSSYYTTYIEKNQGVKPTDEILYALGKTFYAQKNFAKAQEIFGMLTGSGGNFGHLSRYFAGTVYVAQQDYPKAIESFQELLKLSVNTQEQRDVEDLAYMALGRIYMEQGEFALANDSYQNISRDSKYFSDALYEQAWTYIRKGDNEQAIRTIDILLLTFPDNVNVPRLKLVRGHLQERRKAFDDALDTYQKLVAEYTGIRDELDRIMHEQKDILTYFNDLVDGDLSRIETAVIVPAMAVRFAATDKEMGRVLLVARDLKLQQRDLEESYQLLHDIESEVYSNSPRNLLVSMRKVRSALSNLQNLILLSKERVVQCEQVYLAELPDQQARARADSWLAEYQDAGKLAKQLPDLQRDLVEIVEVYEDQVQEVQKNAYRLENLIEDLMAQAAAIEKYISYARESRAISPEVEQNTRFQLNSEREQLDADLKSLSQIQRDIAEMDVRRYVRQSHVVEEEQFRRNAGDRLEKAHKALVGIRSQVRTDPTFTGRTDQAYERLSVLDRNIDTFLSQLDGIETQLVANLKKGLEREKETLAECGTLAQSYSTETGELAEQIARRSFSGIYEQFASLILTADFGITDVYWELKEEKSKEIDQNTEQRSSELESLRLKFSGLQAGDI